MACGSRTIAMPCRTAPARPARSMEWMRSSSQRRVGYMLRVRVAAMGHNHGLSLTRPTLKPSLAEKWPAFQSLLATQEGSVTRG
jgi:hypothetical protein